MKHELVFKDMDIVVEFGFININHFYINFKVMESDVINVSVGIMDFVTMKTMALREIVIQTSVPL